MFKLITEYFNKKPLLQQEKNDHFEQVINGSYKAQDTEIGIELCINGQALLGNKVRVEKKMLVNGQLTAHHSAFLSDVTVNGASSLNHTQIHGEAKFRGSLEAASTTFSNTTEILSACAELENSTAQGIIFKKIPIKNTVQRLSLKKNTEVHGDILFEGGHGEVLCDPTAKIHGQIIGGMRIDMLHG
ncbi:hypothetical protein [Legionella worsleiensis]|uniref:Polymer-forming cytoskeletal n=1 Tax=Legionella worsleiensis TaxID=45076 RepID=A0A0W1AAB1_9GAMM|nr:hypothetical protein [Legionella worsleiensis]KTD78300.1 hypothetical protein Lwor_1695 [Legionella worsleiensis]STY32637.1 Uncharacterised protein [Legionella worsleiensis]